MTCHDIGKSRSPSWSRVQGAETPFAVYVNIPFCTRACSFCHYIRNIEFRHFGVPSEYMTALKRQSEDVLHVVTPRRRGVSCSIGGGTPSLLTPAQLTDLLQTLDQSVEGFDEVSIEIHPADWNAGYMDIGRITRFSLGVQTFNEKLLKQWGRLPYSVDQVASIVATIRCLASAATINIDLLLDGHLDDHDLALARSLTPDSITLYPRTGRKKPGDISFIRDGLRRAASILCGYSPLSEGGFIFRKQAGLGSLYSAHEYGRAGDIIGLGHNSVTYMGVDAFLCVYQDGGYAYRLKYAGDRYLRTLVRGVAVGVTERLVSVADPAVMALLTRRHDRQHLWYIPPHRFRSFHEYIKTRHGSNIAKEFLCSVLYGDDRAEFLHEAEDAPVLHFG